MHGRYKGQNGERLQAVLKMSETLEEHGGDKEAAMRALYNLPDTGSADVSGGHRSKHAPTESVCSERTERTQVLLRREFSTHVRNVRCV